MCLYSRLIKNRKYVKNKKNGGKIPPLPDKRIMLVPIGCGKCIECRKQKSREWQVRLQEDIKTYKNAKFITFTFSNESLAELTNQIRCQEQEDGITEPIQGYDLDNEIATRATRLFLERWRKKHKKSLRHWLVTELGHNGTENIHIHGLVWTNEHLDTVEKTWQYGFMWKGQGQYQANYVNDRTINYLVKYITKIDADHKYYKSKILTSPGIGNHYTKTWNSRLNKFKGLHTDETYQTRSGHKMSLPIYWRNKIYTEKERETLWLQKLDKQLRWICGECIDVSKGDQEYYKTLEFYRIKNKRLGYGDDSKNWSQEQYERERRIILQHQRMKGKTPAAGSLTQGNGLKPLRIEACTIPEGSNSEHSEGEQHQAKPFIDDDIYQKSIIAETQDRPATEHEILKYLVTKKYHTPGTIKKPGRNQAN